MLPDIRNSCIKIMKELETFIITRILYLIMTERRMQIMFCSRCGAEISENANFCPDCGLMLRESNEKNSTSDANKTNDQADSQNSSADVSPSKTSDAISNGAGKTSVGESTSSSSNGSGLHLRAAMLTLAAISGVAAIWLYSSYEDSYWFEYDGGSFIFFILIVICVITGVVGAFSKQ